MLTRSNIRQYARDKRAALPAAERARAARALSTQLYRLSSRFTFSSVACYAPTPDEISPAFLFSELAAPPTVSVLPVMQPNHGLAFYTCAHPLQPNRCGILEPQAALETRVNHANLDAIFVPLVAFDPRGYRLGMGSGYYDRLLSTLVHLNRSERPLFIGLGYACQGVETVLPEAWDIKMDYILTDSSVIGLL